MTGALVLGDLALWVALLLAVHATVASAWGAWREDGRWVGSGARALTAAVPFLGLATGVLLLALLRSELSVRYVASYADLAMPTRWRVVALWAGRGGALLCAALLLAVVAAVRTRGTGSPHALAARGVEAATAAFLLTAGLGLLRGAMDPFERLGWSPADGLGLAPRDRHWVLLLQPPLTLLAAVAATIPFAAAAGAMVAGAADRLRGARRWGWVVLAAQGGAVTLGLWYGFARPVGDVPWWQLPLWDGSVLPLLAAVAFLALVADDTRAPDWGIAGASALAVVAVACLAVTLGAPATRRAVLVIAVLGALFAAGALAAAWRRGVRFSAPAGLVAVGTALAALGLALASAGARGDLVLEEGKRTAVAPRVGAPWEVDQLGLSVIEDRDATVTAATVQLTQGGRRVLLVPELRTAFSGDRPEPPVGTPATARTATADLRVELADARASRGPASGVAALVVVVAPFAWLAWLGGGVVVVGALVGALGGGTPAVAGSGGPEGR